MIINFIKDNALGLVFFVGCFIGLFALSIYKRRSSKQRHAFIKHLAGFLLWSCIVLIINDYLNQVIIDAKIHLLTPGRINFICTTIIILMFLKKSFLFINAFEIKQIDKGRDITDSRVISRVLKITISVAVLLAYGEHFGMSFSGLLAFGGIGGIAVGMAGKDILSNFFSGIMLYYDRPFKIGDWIRSPDRNIEGVVVEIGWRLTRIQTFDNRPMYIPNSIFTGISVENPGRMTNRRIKTSLGLRYEDADKIGVIVNDIQQFLTRDADIDPQQTLLVYFNGFGESSLNILVYCFTKTTDWAKWLEVQQRVFLKFIDIVHGHGADFAFPSTTVYLDKEE